MDDKLECVGENELEVVEGHVIQDELLQQEETPEGMLYSMMSPHHFWLADWGENLTRAWDKEGSLRVVREWQPSLCQVAAESCTPRIWISEVPFSKTLFMGTGGVVWPASLALAQFLFERREALPPLNSSSPGCILEVGAGCGVPALCAAVLAECQESKVLISDETQHVLDNLHGALRLNMTKFRAQVEVLRFSWEEVLEGAPPPTPAEGADLVIGSDVIWGHRGTVLGKLLPCLVRPKGLLIISAEQGREGLAAFENLIQNAGSPGFDVDVIHTSSLGRSCVIYMCYKRSPMDV